MMGAQVSATPLKVLGRYALHEEIASGGMASVHFGRLLGPVGFARTVAIKRLHERLARDPEFTAMFLDEARLAARIRHPNVVPTLDVVALEGELFLVMEYVQGESLSRLFTLSRQQGRPIPLATLTTIIAGALHGLHAAHEATDERGQPLGIVHRDVSPQNILVGVDGVPRVLDFGVAKAAGRAQSTREGQLKGKLSYMAPEQLRGVALTRAADTYAAGVVLWEGLTGRKLFKADTEAELVFMLLETVIEPPSKLRSEVSAELDAIVLKALSRAPADRFASAREMARALEKVAPLVPASDIGEWVEKTAGQTLTARANQIATIEQSSSDSVRMPSNLPRAINEASARESQSQILASPTGGAEPGKLVAPRLPALSQLDTVSEIVPTPLPAGVEATGLAEDDASALREKPRDKRLVVLGLGGLALLLVVAVVGIASRWGSKTEASVSPRASGPGVGSIAPTPPTSGPSRPSAEPAPSAELAPPAPAPTTSGTTTTAVEASAKVAGSATPTVPRASATAGGAVSRPSTNAPPPAPASCNPPYVIDAQGNRRYKRECLK